MPRQLLRARGQGGTMIKSLICLKSEEIFRNFNCLNDIKGFLKLTFFQKIIMFEQILAESGQFKRAQYDKQFLLLF